LWISFHIHRISNPLPFSTKTNTMNKIDESYWTQRWEDGTSTWDLGEVSPPIKNYVDQIHDTNLSILIPGCGNGHEGNYLHQRGFRNVYLLDYSPIPLENFSQIHQDFPKEHLLCMDFFELDMKFDLILEQTFLSALDLPLRRKYAAKMKSLLKPNGKLAGIVFKSHFEKPGPPFGGTLEEYRKMFDPHFEILRLEDCMDSVGPRLGNELFLELKAIV
jgi:methyl halide transferase